MPSRSASSGTPPQWGMAAGEGTRPMTGRRSRSSRTTSSKFPLTGSLKLKIGHIVLVLSGRRYCGLMSLEQSDPSKIAEDLWD